MIPNFVIVPMFLISKLEVLSNIKYTLVLVICCLANFDMSSSTVSLDTLHETDSCTTFPHGRHVTYRSRNIISTEVAYFSTNYLKVIDAGVATA
jgi:hypothetical protein